MEPNKSKRVKNKSQPHAYEREQQHVRTKVKAGKLEIVGGLKLPYNKIIIIIIIIAIVQPHDVTLADQLLDLKIFT